MGSLIRGEPDATIGDDHTREDTHAGAEFTPGSDLRPLADHTSRDVRIGTNTDT